MSAKEHPEIQHEIPAYVAGRLPSKASQELEVHLATCGECQELVATCERIAIEARAEAKPALATHPDPQRLRDHACGVDQGPDLLEHVTRCASCALEVAVWKRMGSAGAVAARGVDGHPPRTLPGWLALRPLAVGSAVGVVATLLVAAILDVGWRTPSAGWSGTAPTLLLREASRSAVDGGPDVVVAEGQPVIPVELELTVPEGLPATDVYHLEVRDSRGRPTARIDATVSDVREQLRQSGVFKLLLGTDTHPPGSYTIAVRVGDEVRQQPFEVRRP